MSAKYKWLSLDAHGQLEVPVVLQRHNKLRLFLAPRHCSLQVFLALCHQQSADLGMEKVGRLYHIQTTLVTGHCHRPLVKLHVYSPLVSQEPSILIAILSLNSTDTKCQLLRCKGSVSQKALIYLNFGWHYSRDHSVDVE